MKFTIPPTDSALVKITATTPKGLAVMEMEGCGFKTREAEMPGCDPMSLELNITDARGAVLTGPLYWNGTDWQATKVEPPKMDPPKPEPSKPEPPKSETKPAKPAKSEATTGPQIRLPENEPAADKK